MSICTRIVMLMLLTLGCVSPTFATITYFASAASNGDTIQHNNATAAVITPPANMRSGQLVYVVVLARDSGATVSITNSGGQSWTTEPKQANGSSSAVSIFWCIYNGTWSASPSFSSTSSSSFALGAYMTVFSPTSGYTIARDTSLASGSIKTPADPWDMTASGQTPTAPSSVSIFSWSLAQLRTFALQEDDDFDNPDGIAQWRNPVGTGTTLSMAYKINTSATATGSPTNRVINGDIYSVTRWTAQTFKETQVSGGAGIKFHPGHYVFYPGFRLQDASVRDAIVGFIRNTVCNESSIKGIQVIAYWSALENDVSGDNDAPTNDYSIGFASIDTLLAELRRCIQPKYLILGLHPVQFGGFDPANLQYFFPDYIVDNDAAPVVYGTTEFNKTGLGTGVYPRFWQQATMDRIIALSNAYAARYNSDPNFEMFAVGETSVNLLLNTDGFTGQSLVTQLQRLYQSARTAWSRTALRLNANYIAAAGSANADDTMAALITYGVDRQISIGGPDTLPSEDVQANRIFTGEGYADYRGTVPFVSEVQSPELGGKECGTCTPAQLYNHAMIGNQSKGINAVKPSYFVWQYHVGASVDPTQNWPDAELPFIRTNPPLYTTCPTGYPTGCTTN